MCEQKDWKLTRVLKMPCAELFHTHPWVRHLSQELTPKVPLSVAVGHLKDTPEACGAQSGWHCLDSSCWEGQPEEWVTDREMG